MQIRRRNVQSSVAPASPSFKKRAVRDFRMNKSIYLMLLPVLVYFVIFHYVPLYGLQIAFKDYSPSQGFLNSPWIGMENFTTFFGGFFFKRLLMNTMLLSFYNLLFAFPAAFILAILINEIRQNKFKRVVQTVTYLPHFVSLVVIVGLILDFLSSDGLVNQLLASLFGVDPISFMQKSGYFRTVFVSSDIWQNIGWNSIIYLAAISSIDPSLYEAAKIDGAGRWKQTLHVTIPGMIPVTVILLILFIGRFMTVGEEKILLMYNPAIYDTADVIGTFVYRKGILNADFSFSAAVGLFKSVISFTLLIAANSIARKIGDNKLW
jgi:putative aldouronate transport system permease protein